MNFQKGILNFSLEINQKMFMIYRKWYSNKEHSVTFSLSFLLNHFYLFSYSLQWNLLNLVQKPADPSFHHLMLPDSIENERKFIKDHNDKIATLNFWNYWNQQEEAGIEHISTDPSNVTHGTPTIRGFEHYARTSLMTVWILFGLPWLGMKISDFIYHKRLWHITHIYK